MIGRHFQSLKGAVGVLCLGLSALLCGAAVRVDVSLDPPGGLAPSNTPQMILLTFDDAVNPSSFDIAQQILTNRWNPNGTPIQATFFVSTDWTDYWYVHRLHAQGHEIAIHTITHPHGGAADRAAWRAEIAGCRRALSRLAGIPRSRIRGFRAPYLEYNAESFRVLHEQGLTYDSSITELPGLLSESIGTMIWPYTLDDGVKQNCWTGPPPDRPLPGLFEIPLWTLYDPTTAGWIAMDPVGEQARVLATLKTNFLARYQGNRAPLGVFLHANGWQGRTAALREFMDWAQTYPDVWFVGLGSLSDFMTSPCTVAEAHAFPPFVTATYAPIPESQTRTLYFDKGPVRTCGETPVDYPAPDTVYLAHRPFAGGSMPFEVTSEWQSGFGASLVVSNSAATRADRWEASFELPGCRVTWLSGAAWRVEGDTVFLTSQNPAQLDAGAATMVIFGGTRTQAVQVVHAAVTFYATGPQQPRFKDIRRGRENVRLEWDDSAFGYAVLESTNGLSGDWRPVAEVHGATSWTGSVPSVSSPTFYRLNAIP